MGWSAGLLDPARTQLVKKVYKLLLAGAQAKSRIKMKITGAQITAARGLLKITQAELAAAAGLAEMTVFRFEAGQAEPYRSSLDKIVSELERRGIEFTNGTGIGVRLNYAKAAEYARTAGQEWKEPDR
jgi:DNA-binding XRE family transcriptional regulator